MSNLKPVIKVLGVGGGGCNAISYMSFSEISGVEFIAANTDAQDLEKLNNVSKKIQLGTKLTNGLGAGADPKIGKKSAEEDEEIIRSYLEGSNLLFISAGMGGGTGTGAAPVIAEIAKKMGLLVIAVVTKPFGFERESRMDKANKGIKELKENVDSLIIIPNEKLKSIIDPSSNLTDVFTSVDQVLHDAVQGISDIVTKPGLINIDFNDLKTIMKDSGNSMIGIGKASGEDRAKKAAEKAISCPFLEESNLSSAKRVIVNVTFGVDGSLQDFEAVGDVVRSITSEGAEVIIGTSIDINSSDETTVTIVATDFLTNEEVVEKLKDEKPVKNISDDNKLPSFLKSKERNKIKTLDLKKEEKTSNITNDEKIEDKPLDKKENITKEELDQKEDENISKIPLFLRKKI